MGIDRIALNPRPSNGAPPTAFHGLASRTPTSGTAPKPENLIGARRGKKPLLLYFDLEDTLTPLKEHTCQILNERYPWLKLTVADIDDHFMEDSIRRKTGISIPAAEIKQIHRKIWNSPSGPGLLEPDLPDVIKELAKLSNIGINTQAVATSERIQEWLAQQGLMHDQEHFVHSEDNGGKIFSNNGHAGRVVVADDRGDVILQSSAEGRPTLVIDWPWNKGVEDEAAARGYTGRIFRIESWWEAVPIVKQLHDIVLEHGNLDQAAVAAIRT